MGRAPIPTPSGSWSPPTGGLQRQPQPAVEAGTAGPADALGLRISVCHFPPGTSKWNKIEHRKFCHIVENWRDRPLVSHEVMVNLIGTKTTRAGLAIRSELDEGHYPTGRQVTDEQMDNLSWRESLADSSAFASSSSVRVLKVPVP